MDQNIDFSGSDQIQTPQYPKINPPSQEIIDEVFQAKGDLMKSIQTFLEEFNYIPFGEKPKILLQAWYKFFAIQYAQPEDSNELFQKLLEDLQIITKELKFSEEQNQNIENTIIELVEICRQKELLCMRDNVDDLIESALNSKLLLINSQRLNKEKKEVKNVVEQPAERKTRIIKSLQNFRVIHKSSISLSNTSQISSVHAVTPILSTKEPKYSPSIGVEEENVVYHEEEEVDLEDIFQIQDVVLHEKLLSINRLIANIESLNDNPSPDCVLNSSVSFPILEESDNSLSDIFSPEFKSFCDHTEETRSGITTTHANDSLPEYDSFCFEIEPDQERLINVVKNDISNDSSNDLLLEEASLFLASDNLIPSEIPVVINDNDELECIDPRDEFDVSNDENDDYSSFMFVIYSKMFLSFLSAESEDTIFDPGISV
uniref:Reverse transcriptase domain-containing protein n=1 Tax=Tanacetum cinerariifolium TaxID=118510 RepID=A0A6L2J9H5_TANCI|nr:hypothetical protein [Tanacetum cinerariifolium]